MILKKKQQLNIPDLDEVELKLIWYIRNKYKWGKIEIECCNGRPKFITKTVIKTLLSDEITLSTDKENNHIDIENLNVV